MKLFKRVYLIVLIIGAVLIAIEHGVKAEVVTPFDHLPKMEAKK